MVAHFRAHATKYVEVWNGEAPDGTTLCGADKTKEEKAELFQKYIGLVAAPDAWCGELEAMALGRKYDTKIVIVPECGDFAMAALHKKGARTVCLWFTGKHFDSLLPVGDDLPAEVKGVTADLLHGIRGGGGSKAGTVWTMPTSRSGPKTVWTQSSMKGAGEANVTHASRGRSVTKRSTPSTVWTESSRPTASKRAAAAAKASTKRSKPGTMKTTPRTAGHPTIGNDTNSVAAVAGGLDEEDGDVEIDDEKGGNVAQEMFEWPCPWCPVTIQAKTRVSLRLRKWKHLDRWHKEEHANRERPEPVVVRDLEGAEAAWQCPLCPCGLTAADLSRHGRNQIQAIKWQHCVRCHRGYSKVRWRACQIKRQNVRKVSRGKRRNLILNYSAAKVKLQDFGQHDVCGFMWPELAKRKGVVRFSLRRAWQCKACGYSCRIPSAMRLHDCGRDWTRFLKNKVRRTKAAKTCAQKIEDAMPWAEQAKIWDAAILALEEGAQCRP